MDCSPDLQKTNGNSLINEASMWIEREIIVKSFKKYSISNAMGGTKEDFIYENADKNSLDAELKFYDEGAKR